MTEINQLHEFFAPKSYKLRLEIDREKREFHGEEIIIGRKIGTKNIRLHGKNLKIISVKINGEKARAELRENDETELVVANRPSDGEDVEISVKYRGKIVENSMHGLYVCKYRENGAVKELLATQFESHSFREVLLGLDEPNAKATFDLTLVSEPNVEVLGNMPATSSRAITDKDGDEKLETTFATTPRMSSYLLAFVIGDLQKISRKTARGVDVNVFSTKAQPIKSLEIAADAAAKLIDFYEEYFDAEYPLPKSDHVALPDFSAGAMENWGLITYRETALLADEKSSQATRHYVVEVIAHELAHQWFGDLVTMKWWNDLWLNESFASMMETFALDQIWPEWQMWQNSATANSLPTLRRDTTEGVQSVRQEVESPDEIDTLFDPAIVYSKGERLLTMLREFIGREAFRDGLRNYFAKFAYRNTEASNLWNELSKTAKIDVAALMNPWLERPGFPVVMVSEISGSDDLGDQGAIVRDNKTVKQLITDLEDHCEKGPFIVLHQFRFSLSRDYMTKKTVWPIPLFANDPNAPKTLDHEYAVFAPKNNITDFQLNIGNFAHYISARSFVVSREQLINFTEIDRSKIIQEHVLLSDSSTGFMRASNLIKLLENTHGESSALVWTGLSIVINKLKWLAETDATATLKLQNIVAENTCELFDKLGTKTRDGDSENDIKLRPIIFARKIWSEHREENNDSARPAISAALEIFAENRDDISRIDGNVRATVLSAAVKFGENSEFNYLLDIYKTSDSAELKLDICSALTDTRKLDQIDELISLFMRTETIRPQDLFYWFFWLARNRFARTKVWSWTRENWYFIEETFAGDMSLDDFPKFLGRVFETSDELREFHEFFVDVVKKHPSLARNVAMAEDEVSTRITQIAQNRDDVIERLTED